MPSGITNSANDLVKTIMNKLKTGKITIPEADEEGNVTNKEIGLIQESNSTKNVKFVGTTKPTYEETYNSLKKVGAEVIVEAIVKEVLSTIVEKASVRLKDRLDTLENDFNALILAMNTAGAGMTAAPLTPVGTALTGIATAGGGATRSVTKTIPKKAKEITDIG